MLTRRQFALKSLKGIASIYAARGLLEKRLQAQPWDLPTTKAFALPGGLDWIYDASALGATQTDGALQFTPGDKSYLSIASNASLQATTTLEVGCWVWLDLVGSNSCFIIKGSTLSSAATLEYALHYVSSGTNFRFSVSNGTTTTFITDTGTAPVINTWYFLRAGLKGDGTLFIQRNGGTEITSGSCPDIQSASNAFNLGCAITSGVYCAGRIDSAYITKRISTPAEVVSLYNAGAGRTSQQCTNVNGLDMFWANCISWWDMDTECDATHTCTDAKGTNHLSFTSVAIIDPTTLNGGFETAGSPFANWSKSESGTSTVNDDTLAPYAGTHCCRFDVDAGNNSVYIYQSVLTINHKYAVMAYLQANSGTPIASIGSGGASQQQITLSTSYALFSINFTSTGIQLILSRYSASSKSIYIDNVTLSCTAIPTVAGIAASNSVTGGQVGKWVDQVSGRNATNTSYLTRPALDSLNGKPAVLFNGTSQVLSNAVDLIGTGDISLILVYKSGPTYGGSNGGRLIDNGQFILQTSSTGKRILLQSNAGTTAAAADNSALINTTFVYIITRTASGITNFYVNNELSGTPNQSSGTPAAATTATCIGNRNAGDRAFDGRMCLLGKYARILTPTEIQATYRTLKKAYSL